MQAITTKFLPATNTKNNRVKAECARGSLTIDYDDLQGDDADAKHTEAAKNLCRKFVLADIKQSRTPPNKNSWSKPFVTGRMKNGNWAHVFVS